MSTFFIGEALSNELPSKIILLNGECVKALEIAIKHRSEFFEKGDYAAMIEDSADEIRIIFDLPVKSEYSRGGGNKQIIYKISRKDFSIKDVQEKLGR